jgi:uncharacterized protein YgiM (DUF1202 family)
LHGKNYQFKIIRSYFINGQKERLMNHSSRNYLVGILLLTVAVFFLFHCATKKEATQPSGAAEQTKPASEPSTQAQESTPPPSSPTKTTTTTSPPSSPPPQTPEASQLPAQRTTEIVLALVNFRQGPSMDSKIISVLRKGTKLTVLEEKAGWLRVRLENGTEGWVGKAMTSEGAKPKSP